MEDINIRTELNELCRMFDANSNAERLETYLSKQVWTPNDRQEILSQLSKLFLHGNATETVAHMFHSFLLDLLVRCQDCVDRDNYELNRKNELVLIALSKLVQHYPDAASFCLKYCESHPSIFKRFENLEELEPVLKKRKKTKEKECEYSVLDLLHAAFKLLLHNIAYFRVKWDWSCLVSFLYHEQEEVRWLACRCIASVSGMSEIDLKCLLKKYLTEEQILNMSISYYNTLQIGNTTMVTSVVNRKPLQESINLEMCTQGSLLISDTCTQVTAVVGILLPRLTSTEKQAQKVGLVSVPSLNKVLRDLALAVACGHAVLLQGPVGCGKTTLIEHIAAETGRIRPPYLLKVHLGDQTDGKLLIGSHCCTEVPGEFIWRPGPLTEAMTKGYWLLLEDIDYAPLDVISNLVSVLESKTLLLPGQAEPIKAAPGFQLFATQRLLVTHDGVHSGVHGHINPLNNLWRKITIEPMSIAELKQVILTKWPVLHHLVDRMLDVYVMFSDGGHHKVNISESEGSSIPKSARRLISTRDLMKWCHRVAREFDLTSLNVAQAAFQDALDFFCQSFPGISQKIAIACMIGPKFNFAKSQAELLCCRYKPEISITTEHLAIGRAVLPRKQNQLVSCQRVKPCVFAHTRQSLALLESVAVCIEHAEPVLLVGETGTGKTSLVQYLARMTGHNLTVINMSQQSDSIDLLGGYKPVEIKLLLAPLRDEYEELFCETFSRKQNAKFLAHIMNCFVKRRWEDLFNLMLHTLRMAINRFSGQPTEETRSIKEKWLKLGQKIHQHKIQVKQAENALAFNFIEGSLVKAMKSGEWILLDEINLAEAETLEECLGGILDGNSEGMLLLERGDNQLLMRHPDFRLFACMNPATDVGKRDLPPGVRNRFTEFFMEELEDKSDLRILIESYLQSLTLSSKMTEGIVQFYLHIKGKALQHLTDGTGHHPHYSLRTLCRALSYASTNPFLSVSRSLYEAFCMSFLTQVDRISHSSVEKLVSEYILGKQKLESHFKQQLPPPNGDTHLCFEGYWILRGPNDPTVLENYILTSTVRCNLKDLARVVAARRHPVLLQGETSVGKTSLIIWLARATGNHCIRINNHEHTDLQEYVGTYSSDANGKLVFKEGALVEAMKKGHWIILDELNLAPTEVLEALNRVLDDNRELFIPETQQTVRAHPRFMLFATQNPPGHYGGRKVLSRAFRDRFIELHFTEIPKSELETILHQRCYLPMSYCKKLIAVMHDLQMRRRESGVFAGKQGYGTLRDLFRWGERYRLARSPTTKFYDWDQHIADEGYMLLAGRVRRPEEAKIIQEVLEKHIKRKVDPVKLFTKCQNSSTTTKSVLNDVTECKLPEGFQHLVWTYNIRRLAVLVGQALQFGEPVLLVGDTGCGKTTIAQLYAELNKKRLFTVNCHMHSEASDFLGGLRPVRHFEEETSNKLFEWVDGPLVLAMKEGGVFLADEISLAEDSVLERLNSVLEQEQTILLAEKGDTGMSDESYIVKAEKGFWFIATMNPGGDYGKKELSPALRNRFTEIWCSSSFTLTDVQDIVEHNISSEVKLNLGTWCGQAIGEFVQWFTNNSIGRRCTVSIRDILSWVDFINQCTEGSKDGKLTVGSTYIHGGCLVFLDSLGSGVTSIGTSREINKVRNESLHFLHWQVKKYTGQYNDLESCGLFFTSDKESSLKVYSTLDTFGIKPFYISTGSSQVKSFPQNYTLHSHTPQLNAQRILRGMQLSKPILLEGIPGVGKTSLVASLAKASGHQLVRINLSEQTDVSDLFGADLPVEDGKGGQFQWRDGPLLQALKAGQWILLDELNLASQSVLEGLNGCLDHRGEICIPELGKTFYVEHETTRIFGCQNPHRQGGARKGLPRSFLNRFTQLVEKVEEIKAFGQRGSPWEFNLRDIFRWCQIMLINQDKKSFDPSEYVRLLYSERMRTAQDKQKVLELFSKVSGKSLQNILPSSQVLMTRDFLQVGHTVFPRGRNAHAPSNPLYFLHHQISPLESLLDCLLMKWMAILVGPSAVGKTSLVHLAATLTGHPLQVLHVNSDMDTTELLGGFEQADLTRPLHRISQSVEMLLHQTVISLLLSPSNDGHNSQAQKLLLNWANYQKMCQTRAAVVNEEEVKLLQQKIVVLKELIQDLEKCRASKEELQVLVKKLKELEKTLATQGMISSGGKFEWVDSILVLALKNGYWLLIDDVNFCSPSVLDRLNGLLEPEGVLIMSEQGVVGNQVPVITPHPDFRIILSMDPKNGEISRAMRNRGVEIYMLGEEEGEGPDSWDMKVLLKSVGLTSPKLQTHLLLLHKSIVDRQKGSERPMLFDLLQSAVLCGQHIQRGIDPLSALQEACESVYVKGRLKHTIREQARIIIKDYIESCSSHNINTVLPVESNHIIATTPPIQSSCYDSCFANILKEGSFLVYSLEEFAESNSSFPDAPKSTTEFIYPIEDNNDWQAVLSVGTLNFFETASAEDWQLRHKWLNHLLTSICTKKLTEKQKLLSQLMDLNQHLIKTFKSPIVEQLSHMNREFVCVADKSIRNSVEQLPLDLRHCPSLLKKLQGPIGWFCPKSHFQHLELLCTSTANRFSLLMCFYGNNTRKHISTKMGFSSLFEISQAVREGHLSVDTVPHPVLCHLVPFISLFSENVENFLKYSSQSCSNSNFWKWREGLLLFDHFCHLCQEHYKPKMLCVQLSLLALHWHWMKKKILPLFTVTDQANNSSHQQLNVIVSHIEADLALKLPTHQKLCSKVKQIIGTPHPFRSQQEANLYSKAIRLSDHVLISQKDFYEGGRNLQIKVTLAPDWIEKLSEVVELILTSNVNVEKAQKCLESVEAEMQNHSVLPLKKSSTEIAVTMETSFYGMDDFQGKAISSRLQLLPLWNFIFVLQERKVLNHVIQCYHQGIVDVRDIYINGIKQLFQYCCGLISAENIALLTFLTEQQGVQLSNIVTPLYLEYFLHLQKHQWIRECRRQVTEEAQETLLCEKSILENYKNAVTHDTPCLLLSYETLLKGNNLSFLSSHMIINVSLELWDEKEKELATAACVLWRNAATLEDMISSQRVESVSIIEHWFCTLLSALSQYAHVAPFENLPSQEDLDVLNQNIELPQEFYEFIRKSASSIVRLKQTNMKDTSAPWELGCAWVNVGMMTSMLLAPWETVDPIHKNQVKLQYHKEELRNIIINLAVRNWISKNSTGKELQAHNPCDLHPHTSQMNKKLQQLKEKVDDLESKNAFRPSAFQFEKMMSEIRQYLSTIGANETIMSLLSKLKSLKISIDSEQVINHDRAQQDLGQIKTWINSQHTFIKGLHKEYLLYRDLMLPFTVGVLQVLHGIENLTSIVASLLTKDVLEIKGPFLLESDISTATCFPYISDRCNNPLKMSLVTANGELQHVARKLLTLSSTGYSINQEVWNLNKASLLEIVNYISCAMWEEHPAAFKTVQLILLKLVAVWNEQEKDRIAKQEEQESLFEYKGFKHENEHPDEEKDNKEVIKHFPTYKEDFADLVCSPEEALNTTREDQAKDEMADMTDQQLSEEQILEVFHIHDQLVKLLQKSGSSLSPDFVTPFLLRHSVLTHISESVGFSLDALLDKDLIGGIITSLSISHLGFFPSNQQMFETSLAAKGRGCYDIYQDPNPSQVLCCRPLLERFRSRVKLLLETFEDHPTLKQVLKVIERILSFSVASPLMKFITGLELLLSTAQDWEVNAHKGVSLQKELEATTELVINWRKLELNCWSQCLDNVQYKKQESCAKWWFHLYSLLSSVLDFNSEEKNNETWNEDQKINIVQSLLHFIETSTLGEFEGRLELLQTFIYHIKSCGKSSVQENLLTIFSNIYHFYGQFSKAVSLKISTVRIPIEKQVKEFVKITRWNDINFWAVRQTVEKSHRMIHKQMKQLDKELNQPVKPVFEPCKDVNLETTSEMGVWVFKIDSTHYLTENEGILLDPVLEIQLKDWPKLFKRMQKIVKEVVTCSSLHSHVSSLNYFSNEIVCTIKELQALDVPSDKDKEKWKSKAHHIHQRKRKALSDLFKSLTLIGLSFRKGSIFCKDLSISDLMMTTFVDVEASFEHLVYERKTCDHTILDTWSGSHHYFYSSISQLAVFLVAIQHASKELTVGIIDRCRGFVGHLLMLVLSQRRDLSKSVKSLVSLRNQVDHLLNATKVVQEDKIHIHHACLPVQSVFFKWKDSLNNVLTQTIACIYQYKVFLQCCPTQSDDESCITLGSTSGSSSLLSACRDDSKWCEALQLLNKSLAVVETNRNLVNRELSGISICTWKHYLILQDCFNNLLEITQLLMKFSSLFDKDGQKYNCFSQSALSVCRTIHWMIPKFKEEVNQVDHTSLFKNVHSDPNREVFLTPYGKRCLKLIKRLKVKTLYSVQELYKIISGTQKEQDSPKDEEGLQDKSLTEKILSRLEECFNIFNVNKMIHLTKKLGKNLENLWNRIEDPFIVDKLTRCTFSVVPLVNQYIALLQYFVTVQVASHRTSCKLLYILLSVFTNLAKKGFCLPDELSDEVQGEGATELKDIEEGGLGEGEGVKDVSEKLESEDQLEDAKQQNDEEKKSDNEDNVKEEEHGVEMSDDFDGKVQDIEQNKDEDNDSEESEEGEDELDKQMGDLEEEDTEKLDEKLWGSDSEDDDNGLKEEGFGSGEQQSQPQLVAKEGNSQPEENQSEEQKENALEKEEETINSQEEEYRGEQPDPYKTHEKDKEPEPMELSEDLKLDDDEDEQEQLNSSEETKDEDYDKNEEEMECDKNEEIPEEGNDQDNIENEDVEGDKKEEKRGESQDDYVNDEEQNGLETPEEEEKVSEEKSAPSQDQVLSKEALAAEDKTKSGSENHIQAMQPENSLQEGQGNQQDDNLGVGEAFNKEQAQGHIGDNLISVQNTQNLENKEPSIPHSLRPKGVQQTRTLGSSHDKLEELKILDLENKNQDLDSNYKQHSDAYKHVENSDSKYDAEAIDLATEEEAKQQPVPSQEGKKDSTHNDDFMNIPLGQEICEDVSINKQALLKPEDGNEKEKFGLDQAKESDITNDMEVDIPGEVVPTHGASRGPDSTIHSNYDLWSSLNHSSTLDQLREELETKLTTLSTSVFEDRSECFLQEAQEVWEHCEKVVAPLVQELCEQIRLVLEPTKAAKMKGDYRTGKRLNMRKIIPYIASQFRKDKIWLRRTKPSKRQYQILMAVDDSSSMAANQSRELAFESLALLGKSLSLLETGELGVMSFGEYVQLLHCFGETFTDEVGTQLVQKFSFQQKKTRIAELLRQATSMMIQSRISQSSPFSKETAQLLIIISDGRGLFNEGEKVVQQAVRSARDNHIFTVFLVLDNPQNKDSILDIKVPIFKNPGQVEIQSYMDRFPFPFYIILKDITSMPLVLGEALRQWFELVTNTDR
ncbi:midasin isoform X2 [Tachypleus tridentatus]|uniref:midasin isoform X2 n=1 Tax=Tachypleus tridentatus TaxID=6853 RepID=UPI003FD25266